MSADIAPGCAREDRPEPLFVLFGALLLDHAPPWYAYLLPIELQSVLRRDSEAKRAAACVRGDLFAVAAVSLDAWSSATDADLDSAIAALQSARSEAAAHVAAALLEERVDRILARADAKSFEVRGIWGAADYQVRDSRLTRAEQRARAAAAVLEATRSVVRERIGVL